MKNDLKRRLAAGDVCLGAWLQSPDTQVAEAMVSCGFDWMAVDLEHGTTDLDQVQRAFLAAERHGVAPLARIPGADPIMARRLLDAGAVGLIVSTVEDADAFTEFARHCLYPPRGRRGVGLSRASLWGGTFAEYHGGFEPVLVPQIETAAGVAAADAIATLDVVDALFLGPYDLSADLGDAGEFETPAFRKAVEAVKSACRKYGKAEGFHQVEPDAAALRARLDEGFRFLAFGTDLIAIRYAFRDLNRILGR